MGDRCFECHGSAKDFDDQDCARCLGSGVEPCSRAEVDREAAECMAVAEANRFLAERERELAARSATSTVPTEQPTKHVRLQRDVTRP